MPLSRRETTAALATLAATSTLISPETTMAQTPIPLEPIPSRPSAPVPGKPGDFDFLTGEWRIQNWRQEAPGDWDIFEGESTVFAILGGVCSVEELRIPARNFSGMGLRLLDVERKVWSDHWVNSRSGVVGTPGQEGSFHNGAGIFVSEATVEGRQELYAGIWDRITPDSCRWRQASSTDGGATWEQHWIMHWTRKP